MVVFVTCRRADNIDQQQQLDSKPLEVAETGLYTCSYNNYMHAAMPLSLSHFLVDEGRGVVAATFTLKDPKEANQREGISILYGECPIPEYITLITTLSDCTSKGRKFTDDVNDFSLEIPEGAIPEGERLTIDVGVALFGPFQFPEGLRPVSPVFWVCVYDNPNFQFSKPVTITIPHFLDLENDEDIQSLGLAFLKANHNKNSDGLYELQPTDGEMDFKSVNAHAILKTTHFCYDCIAAKDIPTILKKSWFCITAVLPEYSASVGGMVYAYFFITFLNLKTCLKCVKNIISKMGLERYRVEPPETFKFKEKDNPLTDPSLKMIWTNPKHGEIGGTGKMEVNLL